jgi:hypothetical protein
MSKRLGVVALILLIVASFAGVSASEQTSADGDTGHCIVLVQNADINPMGIKSVSGSITQGMTNWHYKTLSSYITSMNVNLYWGNPSNSLRLKIYSPDGNTFGPYYDNMDGIIDGHINLNVISSTGLPRGTWRYEVYGEKVTGTQTYSI